MSLNLQMDKVELRQLQLLNVTQTAKTLNRYRANAVVLTF